MLAFLRVIKYAFQDIGRNLGLSFMTVFILILMLLSVNTLLSVDALTNAAVTAVKDQVNTSIYFTPESSDANVKEIQDYLQSFPEVIGLTVQNRDEVMASFKNRYNNNPDVLSALNELGENPFGPTIFIKTREPGDYEKIIKALDVPEYNNLIEAKSFEGEEDAITKLQNIMNRVEKVGFGLSVVFAIIAFLVIFNTIRVAINSQKAEIGIKRLVGASNWFIRGPYLVESFLYSVFSILVMGAILVLALHFIDPYLAVVFPNNFSLTNYFKSNILWLAGYQFLAVLVLNILSSTLAMRKQLKV